MKRLGSLSIALAAGSLGLAACADQTTAPALSANAPAFDVAAEAVAGNYLVDFKNGVPAGFADRVSALGGSVIFAHDGAGVAAVAGLSDASAQQLAATDGIRAVVADGVTELTPIAEDVESDEGSVETPTNPTLATRYNRQWNMRAINARAAWSAGKLGQGVRVGVLDTGIGYTYPELVGRVDLSLSRSFLPAEDTRVAAAFPGAHPVADLHYHGTHVASTIVSNSNIVAGVTTRATIVGLKVCGAGTAANGWRGSCPSSATLAAITYAADIGLDVINMSLGGRFNRRQASAAGGDGPSFIAVINKVMTYANRKGVTVVVSAGNDNIDMDHDGNGYKSYCSAPTVICVSATGPTASAGATGPWTNVDAKATYSNYGRSAVTVAAPGGNTGGAVSAGCSPFSLPFAVCQTGVFVLTSSGTSMAAPHVTGLAALLVAEHGRNPGAIRDRLANYSDDLGEIGNDPIYGKGRINVGKALGL